MTNLDRRLQFHRILCEILGSEYVYFQPPESKKLHYPCIVYNRATGLSNYADNLMRKATSYSQATFEGVKAYMKNELED